MTMLTIQEKRVVGSTLWAAYGDALGFITELADERGVQYRAGVSHVETPIPWTRRIGGKFGVPVSLPAGSYSDDTQLRISTARAIRSDGYFDVEAFAKIELPVWLSYCLGAGRGSKTGAAALINSNVNWFSNFFNTPTSSYAHGGGNGAAMRIQPHVWASRDLSDFRSYLPDVLRNSLCTHGHMRAVVGAAIHAKLLSIVLSEGEIPNPRDWSELGCLSLEIKGCISQDNELSAFWLPTWETLTGGSLGTAISGVEKEWTTSVQSIQNLLDHSPEFAYGKVVESLGGLAEAERGSGLKTTLFALVAAWLFKDEDPHIAIRCIANLLHSDTDTIATMAGALIGAKGTDTEPTGDLQDREFLISEALRLSKIANKKNADEFHYSDLLYWQPPKTALDGVGLIENSEVLAGLGFLSPKTEMHEATQKGTAWQWYELSFGQTVLCKRRTALRNIPISMMPRSPRLEVKTFEKPTLIANQVIKSESKMEMDLFPTLNVNTNMNQDTLNVDDLTTIAIRSGFPPDLIGTQLIALAEHPNGIELCIAYVAILAKARRARSQKQARQSG